MVGTENSPAETAMSLKFQGPTFTSLQCEHSSSNLAELSMCSWDNREEGG